MSLDEPTQAPVPASLSPASRRGRSFRALRQRNFQLYWSGQVISQIGTWMQIVAQSWLVYRLTDSPLMLGLVSFAPLVPVLPISLLAGVISDRFPRRRLILITEIVLLLQALTMAVLRWLDVIQIWHVVALSMVLGAASALEQPARLAFVADTVDKEDLTSAIALNAATYNAARVVGPSLAGLLLAWIGEAGCFFVNGVSFVAVILALLAMRLPTWTAPDRRPASVGSGLVEGFHYVWDTGTIRGLLAIIALSSLLTLPYVALMPVFARDVLRVGSTGLGFLLAGSGIGAIVGALIAAHLQAGRRGWWLVWSNVVGPACLAFFCLSLSFPVSLVVIVLVGASNALRQTLASSLVQILAQERFRGRVMSIFYLLSNGMQQTGALAMGGLAEIAGVPWTVGTGAFLSVALGGLFLWRMPHIRQLP
jgi:MFS family permease